MDLIRLYRRNRGSYNCSIRVIRNSLKRKIRIRIIIKIIRKIIRLRRLISGSKILLCFWIWFGRLGSIWPWSIRNRKWRSLIYSFTPMSYTVKKILKNLYLIFIYFFSLFRENFQAFGRFEGPGDSKDVGEWK